MPKKREVLSTIWIANPHPLQGGQRDQQSVEEAIDTVYHTPILYLDHPYGYHEVQILSGNGREKEDEIARFLLGLHFKWIRESTRPWNGKVFFEVKVGEGNKPDWVKDFDRQHDERIAARMR